MCDPALKSISVTTNGKQCGPQVASVPFDSRTSGAGVGELGGGLLGGRDIECDLDGCGAADVRAGRLDEGGAELLGCADVDGDGDGFRVRVAEVDVEGCPTPSARAGPDPPGEPSGALDSSTGLLTNGIDWSTWCPPPLLPSNTAAPPAPSRQTISTRTATRPTDTTVAASVSSPARNAPQPAQTNSSSASRPHRGHVAISRIQ